MDKLGLGTIGTSWITDRFIDAALETDLYQLNCVYSRSKEKGKEFSSKYGDIKVETDIEAYMAKESLDVIYIALHNNLHYEQAIMDLKSKKQVMVEKHA